jgi:hypothetical protein
MLRREGNGLLDQGEIQVTRIAQQCDGADN